jgi:hypothetical protein
MPQPEIGIDDASSDAQTGDGAVERIMAAVQVFSVPHRCWHC